MLLNFVDFRRTLNYIYFAFKFNFEICILLIFISMITVIINFCSIIIISARCVHGTNRRALAIMFVRLSVCPSVRPFVWDGPAL